MHFTGLLLVVVALGRASHGTGDEELRLPGPSRKESAEYTRRDPQPRQEDFLEAADFGLRAMNNLYLVKEPKLYSMGLFLSSNNPARYVAAFNDQSVEAKQLAKFGFAALEAAKKIHSKFPDISRQSVLSHTNGESVLGQQCPKRGLPQCPPASLRYRTSDGSCNNLKELWWGSAMSTMQRFLPSVYDDGIEKIRRSVTGNALPSAREVSDRVHEERDAPLVSVTHMLMQWGQFIDHDITATGQSTAFNGSVPQCCLIGGSGFQPLEFMHPDCLPIAVHPQDSHLSKLGVRCLEFVRSGPAPREDCHFGPREQLSQVTSFIDASTVYSSSAQRCDSLRIFRNGLMQYGKIQSRRPVLPRDDSDLCRRGSLSTNCFRAGDGRLSEQPALISLHVIFLRMHNRIATLLSALNQHWSDERIFQESRKIIGALVQHITYREFLPIVLGMDVMKIFDIEPLQKGYYKGYDQSTNPNIANAFSSAAYRFGHSLVQHSFVRFDKGHRPILNNVTIHEEFSNPVNLETPGSVDRILLGLINQPSQKRDEFISEELTNHLFQTPGFPFGMDLASLNIQRGRDHGIPAFVEWRGPCMLSSIKSWKDLERIMVPETARKFKNLYAAVEDIDLFSAGLAEKPVAGGLVGATFACIIAQQFRNLRKGDRFWYENPFTKSGFSPKQLQQIRRVTLAQILCRTLDNVDSIQPFVMLAADNLRNQRLNCSDPMLDRINFDAWIENPARLRQSFATDAHGPVYEDEAAEARSNDGDAESRAAPVKIFNQRIPPPRDNPVKSTINQQNRIVVKRPVGPGENITIIVNNHAVHAPIIIRDSVYGSNFNINQPSTKPSVTTTSTRPTTARTTTTSQDRLKLKSSTQRPAPYQQQSDSFTATTRPYYPQNFQDQNNPNPPDYGLNAKPLNNYTPNNEFFSYDLPNIINTLHSQLQKDHYHESHETFYSITRKTKPTQQPFPNPFAELYDFNQQESYNPTKKSNLPYRPNIRLITTMYNNNKEIEPSEIASKLQGSYSHVNDKTGENFYSDQSNNNYNPYKNFEPNKSDRDDYNQNYRSRPTNKPREPIENYQNRWHNDRKPPHKGVVGITYDRIQQDTSKHSNSPSQQYSVNSSLRNSSNIEDFYDRLTNTDNLSANYNLQRKDAESDLRYASSNKKLHDQLGKTIDLPRPIERQENRESKDEVIESSFVSVEGIIKDVEESVARNTKRQADDVNVRTIEKELEKSSAMPTMINDKMSTMESTGQRKSEKILNGIIHKRSTESPDQKVPSKIPLGYIDR